jgi:hypothetical protein
MKLRNAILGIVGILVALGSSALYTYDVELYDTIKAVVCEVPAADLK